MTSPKQFDDRIDTPINGKLKAKYRKHAWKKYGLGLAAWFRMLARLDFGSDEDDE